MTLKFVKETQDVRGKIMWINANKMGIHIVETKKNFARGGHYHPFDSIHMVIAGTIEYREIDPKTKKENVKQVKAPSSIFTKREFPHLITATEDSIFAEIFENPYEATDYQAYRR